MVAFLEWHVSLKKRNESRYSWLLFFIPVIVIAGLVIVPILGDITGGNLGRLEVEATASVYPKGTIALTVQVNVNGTSVTTPSTLNLHQGYYTVTFPSVAGYWPPTTRQVPVQSGKTVYAVQNYVPIRKVVSFGQASFNSTHVAAVHGVTPVIWVNVSSQVVTLQTSFFGTRPVQPRENTSYVFQTVGTFTYSIFGEQSVSGTVTVS